MHEVLERINGHVGHGPVGHGPAMRALVAAKSIFCEAESCPQK